MNILSPEARFKARDDLVLPPGNLFTRNLVARIIAHVNHCTTLDVVNAMWPNDKTLIHVITKATSAPAMTTTAGWAAELAQRLVADVITALAAASCAIDVMKESLVLSWSGAGSFSVPTLAAAAGSGSFVAEGNPIPVRQLSTSAVVLQPYKVASIAVLTREMIESSNAEALISDTLIRSAALAIDAVFFGNAASSAAQPAGIRNGVSTITPSNNADFFAAVGEDVAALVNAVGAVGAKGPYILVSNAGRSVGFRMRFDDSAITPIMSNAVGNDLVAIAPQAIATAFSITPDVETANTGTLMMDTAPQVAGTTGQSERSLYQTDSLAIKIRWPVSWIVRDARGVAWTTPSWK